LFAQRVSENDIKEKVNFSPKIARRKRCENMRTDTRGAKLIDFWGGWVYEGVAEGLEVEVVVD